MLLWGVPSLFHGCPMSNVNRRAFLASAAVATATASRLSAADGDRLRVGCIGVGGRGTALLRNFLEAKLGDVVAVCDIKEENAKRAATAREYADSIAHDL